MDLSQTTKSYGVDDHAWLGSRHGIDNAQPCTLDTSAFMKATHYPEGFFKSGIPLGLITATELYGPYDNAASDGRQTFVGHLFAAVRAPEDTTHDPIGAIFLHGLVNESRLPLPVDAAGKADVAGRLTYV